MATTTSATAFLDMTLASYDAIEEDAAELHREQVVRVHGNAVRMTARDTGRAQGSYIGSQGSPSTEVPPPGRYASPTSAQIIAALAGAGLAVVKFIANNVPYVIFLELGTTRRAGDHGMERAVRAEAS